jgi:hypothetical protein
MGHRARAKLDALLEAVLASVWSEWNPLTGDRLQKKIAIF